MTPWWVPLAQSSIQAIGVITAAVAGILLWRFQMRQERVKAEIKQAIDDNAAADRRAERVRDILIALHAEIAVDIERLELTFGADVFDAVRNIMVSRLAERREAPDKKDMPQAPSASEHFIFDAVKDDLTLLPAETIDVVIRFYRYERLLDTLTKAFASGMFEGLSDKRQTEAVDQYMALGARTLEVARKATTEVEKSIGDKRIAPEDEASGARPDG